ncbi:MAG: hypothetical protein ABI780_02080 [Ardenticatenales bacterium]
MTRPFHPIDAERVIRLQAHSTSLDVESAVLYGQAPLTAAVAGWLRWPGVQTKMFVHDAADGGAPDGFVVIRRPKGRAAADIVAIAPALDAVHGASYAWQRMIGDAIVAVGLAGCSRLLATVEADDALALQVLQQSGFTEYGGDTLLRLDSGAPPHRRAPIAEPERLVAQPFTAAHRAPFAALYRSDASTADRPAVSPAARMASAPPRRRFGRERWRAVVDGRGRLHGAVRIVASRRAIWLGLLCRPDADAAQIIDLAVDDARRVRPGVPLWTAIGDHSTPLVGAATAIGFTTIGRRRLVARVTGSQRIAASWREPARAMPTASTTASSSSARALPEGDGWTSPDRGSIHQRATLPLPSPDHARHAVGPRRVPIRPDARAMRASARALPEEGT